MSDTKKGIWNLQQVRDQILGGNWVQYSTANDPGTLWTWGINNCGQLGDNTTISKFSPVQIPGTQWLGVGGGAGGLRSFAIKTDGSLWGWGDNPFGSLGDYTATHRSSPVQIGAGQDWKYSKIRSSRQNSAFLNSCGQLYVMGWNLFGQLGQSDSIHRCYPTQVPGNSWCDISVNCAGMAALKTDGTYWVWGQDAAGWFGLDQQTSRCSPVQLPGTRWVQVSVSGGHNTGCNGPYALARKSDGTLWSWGCMIGGSGGRTASECCSSPVQIPGTQWNDVCASGTFAFGRKTDGTLWGWGTPRQGSLGFNDNSVYTTPTQIPGAQWRSISASYGASRAFKTDGTLWVWGGFSSDGATSCLSSPVQLPGLSWSIVATAGGEDFGTGCAHSLAKKTG